MPDSERRCPKCGATYGGDVLFCPADGGPLTARPLADDLERLVGRTIDGDVKLEALIGIGAMASVFVGRQGPLDRRVAVKLLHREFCQNAEMLARFRREARAAARIRHPNVVEVLGVGELAGDGAGSAPQPYQVLEYLDGLTLRSALNAAGGTLPIVRVLGIVLELCDAVGEAHALGIVHRDLKPENIMLVPRGANADFVKLLDFGLSRMGENDASIETRSGAVLGTARYLSPEGARGEPVGPAADVYGIATILFECLSGRTPFDGDRPVAILVKKASEAAPEVTRFERARDVPQAIEAILEHALARDPRDRPHDARAFAQALSAAARESGIALDGPSLRPGLLGDPTPSATVHARTRLLGSTPVDIGANATRASEPPRRSAPRASSPPPVGASSEPPRGTSTVRRVGVIAGCFVLGVLGALGLATHVGGCGGIP
jgi:serine/threonine-protein kinase